MDQKSQAKNKKVDGEAVVLAAIADMAEDDRVISERLHAIISESAPQLLPRTWYGMPAYTNGDKIILFFRSRQKFGERFMTLGFNDTAKLDDGTMWPIYYALTELTADNELKIAELVKRAAS
jgi:hypothetical protein